MTTEQMVEAHSPSADPLRTDPLRTDPPRTDADGELRAVGDYRLIALLVGACATGVVAWYNPDRLASDTDQHNRWVIYAMIAVVLGAAAGEAFGFGIARWRELRAIRRVRLIEVLPMVTAVIGAAAVLLWVAPQFVGDNVVTSRGWLMTLVAVVGVLPTAAALATIQRVARRPLPGSIGAQLAMLMHLRRTLARLLNQLGLIVILVMAVNGAAWADNQAHNAALFSGAVGSLVVGVMYVPAATTLRRRAATFVARNFSLDAAEPAGLLAAAEDQAKLEKLLGLDQTTFSEMKAGLVILTPFVASALSTFIDL
ncbi:hypothetical protein [Hamadaea tsunoensis]|uniref:hypothetical protein n=1 Tax=Hamadaea tsunoensis TaxID=53368 RepID=UPI000484C61C|nr:hypothetical protein [Hamadaea tsunoensis]